MTKSDVGIVEDALDGYDWLGTGSSSKDADKERDEVLAAWDRIKGALLPQVPTQKECECADEIDRLRSALVPFADLVNDAGMHDPRNSHRASVRGRAGNDAYRAAWSAINNHNDERDMGTLKHAFYLYSMLEVSRYLASFMPGRKSHFDQSSGHLQLCAKFVAITQGVKPDHADMVKYQTSTRIYGTPKGGVHLRGQSLLMFVHDNSKALAQELSDEGVIDFENAKREDIDRMTSCFSDQFYDRGTEAIGFWHDANKENEISKPLTRDSQELSPQ